MSIYNKHNGININAYYFPSYTISFLWPLKNSFDEERRTLLTKHRKKWENQMKERSEKEVQHVTYVRHTHTQGSKSGISSIDLNWFECEYIWMKPIWQQMYLSLQLRNMMKGLSLLEEYEDLLQKLRVQTAEEYNMDKIRLDTEVQVNLIWI